MSELNHKQKMFAKEYIVDLNATQAAIRAGYSEKTAYSQGQRLLKNVEIQKVIQEEMNARSARTEITADNVLKELSHIAFDDMSNYLSYEPDPASQYGVRINIKDSSEIDTRNISEVSIGKDGFKFKLYCKDNALVNLGKHLKLFTDKQEIEHSGSVQFVDDIGSGKDET